ncbi:hypothetical protein SO694_00243012 [Aureococcus anophagefferens]|uniref:Uncharacterized protein n=1 Tax=Aureococcus anophagefferens TaxID=44056 RepID=A0ABR1FRH6_AURAN
MAAQMSLRQAGKLLALVALIVLAVRAVLNQPAASAPAPPASHAKMPALPATLKAEYDALSCDGVLKTLAAALAAADAAAPKADGPLGPRGRMPRDDGQARGAGLVTLETCPKSTEPLPLVAVCCGTTTRGKGGWITPPPDALEELAVFDHLLPSFGARWTAASATPSSSATTSATSSGTSATARRSRQAWFDENVKSVLAAAPNAEAELRFAVVDNKIKKPGPVFTAITRHALRGQGRLHLPRQRRHGVKTKRARHFAALATMDNVGAVGPMCKQGNRKILTHDFTHRKHMDIFEGTYYRRAQRLPLPGEARR